MLRNQSGFTYPLTLCLLIIFSTVLVIHIEQYVMESRMLKETETILKQDYYLLNAVRTIESTLATEGNKKEPGSILFNDGQANYVIMELTDQLWEIDIHLKTGTDQIEISGLAYYDTDIQKVIKWIEKN
jgi:ComG operon protein 7